MNTYKLLYVVATLSFLAAGIALAYEGDTMYLKVLGVGAVALILGRLDEELNTKQNEN
jgi:hypothetical protein